jgi:phosphoserine phosphatase RsbU/P
MENSKTLEKIEIEIENLNKLLKINHIINSVLDIGKLLNIIMETIKEIMDTETSTLLLVDELSDELVFKVALGNAGKELAEKYRIKIGQGIAGWVAKNKKAVFINNVYDDARFDPQYDKITGFTSKAILCVPLLFKGKLIGVIQAINPQNRTEFDNVDMSLFTSFADQAALAVQNALFFHNALEEQRIKNEIASAVSFHQSLLPVINTKFKNITIAAKSISAHELGGEFYDINEFPDETAGIIIGDIHQKGISGALHASMVLGAIKTLSLIVKGNPAGLLTNLNNILNKNLKIIDKISLFFGLVNPAKKEIQFVNTGFSYVILIRDNVARYIKFKSLSPGDSSIPVKKINLIFEPGDFFIIITDGLINIKNRGGQTLGLKRIMDKLNNNHESPSEIINLLFKLADEFGNGLEQREDISIIAVKIDE